MRDKFVTRRQLQRLLMLSTQQLNQLRLDQNIEKFNSNGKGYAICYRLKDVERYLKMRIPSSGPFCQLD